MSRKLQNANLYNFMNDVKIMRNHVGKLNINQNENNINTIKKKINNYVL